MSGLQLIAPDHTAYRAYLDPGVASLIPAEQVPADRPHDSGTRNCSAEPNGGGTVHEHAERPGAGDGERHGSMGTSQRNARQP